MAHTDPTPARCLLDRSCDQPAARRLGFTRRGHRWTTVACHRHAAQHNGPTWPTDHPDGRAFHTPIHNGRYTRKEAAA